MLQDPELWLVLLSLAVTIVFIGNWIMDAGDDWLQSELDSDFRVAGSSFGGDSALGATLPVPRAA